MVLKALLTRITHLNSYCSFLPPCHHSNRPLCPVYPSLVLPVSVIYPCTTNSPDLNRLKSPSCLFTILWVGGTGFSWMVHLWLTGVVRPHSCTCRIKVASFTFLDVQQGRWQPSATSLLQCFRLHGPFPPCHISDWGHSFYTDFPAVLRLLDMIA